MHIRNRMADIVQLRCHVCQDFLRMVLPDGWQQFVYQKAKSEVENNSQFKANYISAYERMRANGIDNFKIEDMDITFMYQIVNGCKRDISVKNETIKAMRQLNDNRKVRSHSGENEEAEELYFQAFVELNALEQFIKVVDRYEIDICDEKRIEYLQKYNKAINELKGIIDEERIAQKQRIKDMEKDIDLILDSNEPLNTWVEIIETYWNRSIKIEKNSDVYFQFVVMASNAGIKFAHGRAATYYAVTLKDYAETERRLYMLYNSYENEVAPVAEMKMIVDTINDCLIQKCPLREGFIDLINRVREKGFIINQAENGLYIWEKRKK